MPDEQPPKTLVVWSKRQIEILDKIRDRWQERIDDATPLEGRTRINRSDVIRAAAGLMAQLEGFDWPEDDVKWGGNPLAARYEPPLFIRLTDDRRAVICRAVMDNQQECAQNWQELEPEAFAVLIEQGMDMVAGDHPCPPWLAAKARWPEL